MPDCTTVYGCPEVESVWGKGQYGRAGTVRGVLAMVWQGGRLCIDLSALTCLHEVNQLHVFTRREDGFCGGSEVRPHGGV